MPRTVVSRKGQIVIPKQIRDMLGLVPGSILEIRVEGKKIVLEPAQEPPKDIFVKAGEEVVEPLLLEAKSTGDKALRILRDLEGV